MSASLAARLFLGVTCVAGVIHAGTPAAPTAFNVAHRGASAYAPEHTPDAYTLAIAQGADYVEPDLCITRDRVLVVSHDPTLERTTDVEQVFPDRFETATERGRSVKHWFVEDFTLAELKTLDHGAWFDAKFAGRRILTFEEAIDLLKGKVGIMPELKTPGRLRAKGFEMEEAVADILKKRQLTAATVKGRPAMYLQSFEEDSLRRLTALLPDTPRTFLIGSPEGAAKWLSAEGMKDVRRFATAVSPEKNLIDADPAIVARAHAEHLLVVPYTFQLRPRTDPYPDAPAEYRAMIDQAMRGLPERPEELTAAMKKFVDAYAVDGLFTDNPDLFPRPASKGSR